MPRFQMDDSLYDDPAVIRAGTAAFGLYARCGDYVARQLLDGYVPSEVAAQWGTPEWTRKLTDAGLWEAVEGGYHMPRYLTDNPSRAKVEAERKAKSERQQRWLEKQRNPSPEPRRVSRPSRNASNGASRDGQKDNALPPSLREGRGAAAPYGAQRGAPSSASVTEALAVAVPNGHRPASPEAAAAAAAAAKQALARRTMPP